MGLRVLEEVDCFVRPKIYKFQESVERVSGWRDTYVPVADSCGYMARAMLTVK